MGVVGRGSFDFSEPSRRAGGSKGPPVGIAFDPSSMASWLRVRRVPVDGLVPCSAGAAALEKPPVLFEIDLAGIDPPD